MSFLENLTNIFEHANFSVVVSDMQAQDDPIVFVNKHFENLMGYSKNEVLGKNCRFLQGEKTSKHSKERIRKGIENKETFKETILNYKKNGEEIFVELHLSPVYNENCLLTHYVGIQTDATEDFKEQLKDLSDLKDLKDEIKNIDV